MSEGKKRIVGFKGVEAAFGGKVPSAEELEQYEVVEDGKVGRVIDDLSKATVFKRDNLFLLFSDETAAAFQQVLEQGGARSFRYDLGKAFEIHEKIKSEVNSEQDRYQAIERLVTYDYGHPRSVWVRMKTIVEERAVSDFSPCVGTLWDGANRLAHCAENAAEFEKDYAEALALASPKDRKEFSQWEEQFRKSYWAAGKRVPFVKGLKLVTRKFGRFGTFGCFVLEDDVELFKELHGKKRDRDGKLIFDRDGKAVPVFMYHSDAYLGTLRWKLFLLQDEERQIQERKDEDDAKELKMCENLGGFVDDETLRFFHKNGNGESRGLKKLGRRDYERRNRRERQLERD